MDRRDLDALNEAATESAFRGSENQAYASLTEAIEAASGHADRAELLLDRAVVQQVNDDPVPSARDALAAVEAAAHLDDREVRATASAIAAGFVLRTGDLDHAIDLAIDSMVLLSGTDTSADGVGVFRAYNALSVMFSRLAAFELAVDTARSAWEVAQGMDDTTVRSIVAYNLCSCALERLRAHDCGAAETAGLVDEIVVAVDFLCLDALSETARLFVGPGMRAELALLGHADASAFDALDAADRIEAESPPPQMRAWHGLVRSLVARRTGDLETAASLVDEALVTLRLPAAEEHNLLRAMRQRAELRGLLGDFEGAASDLEAIVERLHRAQLGQVGRLSAQIRHRAESEIARARVRDEVATLVEQMASDELTGVGSRRWLERSIEELSTSSGTGAVVMFDLDRFKAINDTFGHVVGDRVLATVGSVLLDSVRIGDVAARFGGEEFVMILPGATVEMGVERAELIASRLRSVDWSDEIGSTIITMSAGVAAGPFGDIADLVELADQRLYLAKFAGRDRIVGVSSPASDSVDHGSAV